ncbi:hypothetical protein HanRHA438_Chr12g0534061 [Helianthus annuus]|nr:hypothetical protein HanRHA438_Chr12g0534061 [Helianthus annuus]
METKRPLQRSCKLQILRLLVLTISLVVVIVLTIISQLITFPYTLSVPPVTKGILVNESGPVLRTLSIAHKTEVVQVNGSNEEEEEGCKGYGCNYGHLLSQTEMKQNDSGQTVAVTLKPTRLSYMVSVLVAARFSKNNKLLSARERELKHAQMKIENGPMLGSTEGLSLSQSFPVFKVKSLFMGRLDVSTRVQLEQARELD